jgi:outer membrane lipoprotein-sorting protein
VAAWRSAWSPRRPGPRCPTAAQLLVDLQTARLDGLSGTVVERAELGLPTLPGFAGRDSSSLTSLLSGTHTLRLWYSGPSSVRVALLGTLDETDLITNGTDLWTWSSQSSTATHRRLPAHPGKPSGVVPPTNPLGLTPQQIANAALAAIDPSTVVSTAGSARIAGRDAYELVLAPRDAASLVSQIRVGIDATAHVPLRVQVFARGKADPAIEVAFTQVSFTRPGPEHFRFTPPPGVTVTEAGSTGTSGAPGVADGLTGTRSMLPDLSGAAVVGKGWTTVLVLRLPASTPDGSGSTSDGSGSTSDIPRSPLTALLSALPTVHGPFGTGRVLSGTLFSVLLTEDGRLLVGAVQPARLVQAASDPAAAVTK